MTGRAAPLHGVRVLDLTRFIAGPYCSVLLADEGAEVVKVEPPGGEASRTLGPMLPGSEISTYFLRFNRSKKSVCVDLRTDRGREVLRTLVRHADVLVENFRPGVMERMGFPWGVLEALNPRLIYVTITGFGYFDSPLKDRGAFTPIVEALTGSLAHRRPGADPQIAAYPVGDLFPAALAAGALAMALYRREHDGRGARVDMAMFDAMLAMNERAIALSAMTGRNHLPGLRQDIGSAPSDVFRAKDGHIAIAVAGEPLWQRLCEAIGRPDWAADDTLASGPARCARLDDVIVPGMEAWLADKTRDEAVRILTAAGIPAAGAILPLDVLDSEQAQARDMITRYPAFGHTATVASAPIRFGDEPRAAPGPAPEVGEHTVEILSRWAGLERRRIDELLESGVVVQSPTAVAL